VLEAYRAGTKRIQKGASGYLIQGISHTGTDLWHGQRRRELAGFLLHGPTERFRAFCVRYALWYPRQVPSRKFTASSAQPGGRHRLRHGSSIRQDPQSSPIGGIPTGAVYRKLGHLHGSFGCSGESIREKSEVE
jgi:hypothetical protein